MVVLYKLNLEVRNRNETRSKPKRNWGKFKNEDCCRQFRIIVKHVVGYKELIFDIWEFTNKLVKVSFRCFFISYHIDVHKSIFNKEDSKNYLI